MNNVKCLSITLRIPLILAIATAHGQGTSTFQNLDFELAQIPQNQPPGIVSGSLALPFWTVYYGTAQQTQVDWNETSAGSTQVTLLGLNGDNGFHPAIDGGYSVNLIGSTIYASISQVGQLPIGAVSLLFKVQFGQPGQQLIVSVGGVSLPIVDVLRQPNYNLYGVNVSQFAGMQEELRFSVGGPLSSWTIDDIAFSNTAVPEPTTPALLAVGTLVLGVRVFRRNQ